MWISKEEINVIRRVTLWVVVIVYTTILLAVGWLVISDQWSYSWLFLSLIPILICAILYPRWVYYLMMLIAVIVETWVAISVSMSLQMILITVGISAFLGILAAELLYSICQLRQKVVPDNIENEDASPLLVENLPFGILVFQDGKVVFANQTAVDIAGVENVLELLEQEKPFGISDKDLDRLREYQPNSVQEASKTPLVLEMDLQPTDGRFMRAKAVVNAISFGGHPALQVVLEDVTKQWQDCLDSEELLNRYRLISEVASDCAYVASVGVGEEFVVDWGMEELSGMTGYSAQELSEFGDMFLLFHPDDQHLASEHRKRILSGNVDTAELRVCTNGGEDQWVQSIAKPVEDPETGEIVQIVGILRKISDRKLTEKALQSKIQEYEKLVDDLKSRQEEDSLLIELGDLLQSCLTSSEVYAVVGQISKRLFSGIRGALFILDEARQSFGSVVSWGDPIEGETTFSPQDCWALRRARNHIYAPPEFRMSCPHVQRIDLRDNTSLSSTDLQDANEDATLDVSPHICIPMNAQGDMMGILHLQYAVEDRPQSWLRVAAAMAGRVGLALANLKLRESLDSQAHYDHVTGLYSHGFWVNLFRQELDASIKAGRSMILVLMDIDNFTRMNETYGRDAGDQVLKELGSLITNRLRRHEFVGRFGADTFVLALPEITLEETLERTANIKAAISDLRIVHQGRLLDGITVTVSISGHPWHGNKLQDILYSAEIALQKVKREGGNKIVLAE